MAHVTGTCPPRPVKPERRRPRSRNASHAQKARTNPIHPKLCGRPSSPAAGGPARHENFSRLLEIQDLEDTVNN